MYPYDHAKKNNEDKQMRIVLDIEYDRPLHEDFRNTCYGTLGANHFFLYRNLNELDDL
jgi:hypothetical protein